MSDEIDRAAPCRHAGAPADWLVDKVVRVLEVEVARDTQFLKAHGITPEEYDSAYRVAVERIRGKISATDKPKKDFVDCILASGLTQQKFCAASLEDGGLTKSYRVELPSGRSIGLVRKGCPDGNHSARWDRPAWADELYIWWLCPSSRANEPGASLWKGVGRIKNKALTEPENQLDGVIFYDQSCGTPERPCPKRAYGLFLSDGERLPPPCIFVNAAVNADCPGRLNWNGEKTVEFPPALLSIFGVPESEQALYTSFIGYELNNRDVGRVRITNNYGAGRTTSHTS